MTIAAHPSKRMAGTLIALLLITASLSAAVALRLPAPADATSSLLKEPRLLGELDLRRADDHSVFTQSQLQNRWSLVYTGYLNCPDLCPTTLALLTQLHRELPPGQQAKVQIAFASIDYQRDSAQLVQAYTGQFSDAIVPLTGSAEALAAFTRALGFIHPPKQRRVPANGTLPVTAIAHSSAVALINPNAQLHALFRYPHNIEQIKTTLRKLVN